jgi:phospholipid/cholesterol/gamma-HCH transport system permease protein
MLARPNLHLEPNTLPPQVTAGGYWQLTRMEAVPDWDLPKLPPQIRLQGEALDALDTSGAYFLIRALLARGATLEGMTLGDFNPQHRAIFELVRQHYMASMTAPAIKIPWLAKLGVGLHTLIRQLASGLSLVGVLGTESSQLLRHPNRFRMKEFVTQLQAVFVTAIPLVLLIMFLLGVVFAYLLGRQAVQYGANVFVVDGTTLALCRELSPVLVAILVAGRSGAAMTAQLGTMKFDEEIDAIRVLGLSPYAVLIIPRLLALVLALPLLVFLGDLAGILGSMVVAAQQLGIGPIAFIHRMITALDTSTVVIGLGKAPIFAAFIGLIACQNGLHVARNARSIGLNTTATVVHSIVAVILLNALIAVTLVNLGI